MNEANELLNHLHQLHTTKLGVERIKKEIFLWIPATWSNGAKTKFAILMPS